MDGKWSRLTRLGIILTIAGVVATVINGYLSSNTDLLGNEFTQALSNLAVSVDRVDDLLIVIGVVILLVGVCGRYITEDEANNEA